jgi:hypothetical protein
MTSQTKLTKDLIFKMVQVTTKLNAFLSGSKIDTFWTETLRQNFYLIFK